LVAACDLDRQRMQDALTGGASSIKRYTDADRMMTETKPDILCFSTPPGIRLELVELAVKHSVKGLVFEKPMALSLDVARRMTRLCNENQIKAIVCFQHKYLTSFQKLKKVLDKNEIGDVQRIEASCQAGLSLLGTHYIDYILWANGKHKAKWVAGHVHGKELLAHCDHPSPDYTLARMEFENGVTGTLEFGKLSAMYMGQRGNCIDNRLTVYGSHGHAWCDTDGGWGLLSPKTGGKPMTGKDAGWAEQQKNCLQEPFVRDLFRWLDDNANVHPCNIDISYHGYEIMEAICRSALDCIRIDLPLGPDAGADIFERLRRELPECPSRY
jgi:predicted dehydrogenase